MVAEHICGSAEPSVEGQILDALVPQMAKQLLEVPKIIPQDRILRQTVKQVVNRSEAKRADLAEAEKSLAALMTSQAVSKSSYTQVASDHEASGRVFADELKALTGATQVLQSETGGADGQTYSLFQENSVAAFTDIDRSQRIRYGDQWSRRLAEQGHSAALAQPLISHLCNHERLVPTLIDDTFVKVKDLIIGRSAGHRRRHCLRRISWLPTAMKKTSKTTEKKEDLEAAVVEDRYLLSVAYKNAHRQST